MGCVAKPGESSLQQELTRPRRLSLVESEVVGDSSGGFGSVCGYTCTRFYRHRLGGGQIMKIMWVRRFSLIDGECEYWRQKSKLFTQSYFFKSKSDTFYFGFITFRFMEYLNQFVVIFCYSMPLRCDSGLQNVGHNHNSFDVATLRWSEY